MSDLLSAARQQPGYQSSIKLTALLQATELAQVADNEGTRERHSP